MSKEPYAAYLMRLEKRNKQIWQAYQKGERVETLAGRYGLKKMTIYSIVRRYNLRKCEAESG